MDKALVLGTKDCKFESCQDHLFESFSSAGFVRINHFIVANGCLV